MGRGTLNECGNHELIESCTYTGKHVYNALHSSHADCEMAAPPGDNFKRILYLKFLLKVQNPLSNYFCVSFHSNDNFQSEKFQKAKFLSEFKTFPFKYKINDCLQL